MQSTEIVRAIISNNYSNDDLNKMVEAVQYARAQLGKAKIRSFAKGDTVKFYSTKRNVTVQGTVTKVAIKYVTVKDGFSLWKVPANMLESV
jgi:hypothetical protein